MDVCFSVFNVSGADGSRNPETEKGFTFNTSSQAETAELGVREASGDQNSPELLHQNIQQNVVVY